MHSRPVTLRAHLLAAFRLALLVAALVAVHPLLTNHRLPAAVSSRVSGQINLHNDRFDAVRVEVRVGAADQCDSLPTAGLETLHRGQTWGVITDGVVCWRREADPGSGNNIWTTWASQVAPVNAAQDVEL